MAATRAASPPAASATSGTAAGIADYYERYWRDGFYVVNPYERWKTARVHERVSVLQPGSRVLDIGCGDGRLLAELATCGHDVFGLDLSKAAIDALRARGLEGERADIDGGALPIPDGAFDLVLCTDVFEHLFAPDHLLREIHRVLAPRGVLVASVPNGLNLFNRVAFAAGKHIDLMDKAHTSNDPFSEHIRFFSRDVYETFLRDGGFEPTSRDYFFPDEATDSRFRFAASLVRALHGARLHERAPSLFALEFLYTCRRVG